MFCVQGNEVVSFGLLLMDLRLGFQLLAIYALGFEAWVQDLGFRVYGVQGCQIQGLEFQLLDFTIEGFGHGFKIQGLGFGVWYVL